VAGYPYTWHWRSKHGERHRQPCRVWARGSMNSIGVEFEDGFRTVTARFAIRKRVWEGRPSLAEVPGGAPAPAPSASELAGLARHPR
jgi:hypothetical protein